MYTIPDAAWIAATANLATVAMLVVAVLSLNQASNAVKDSTRTSRALLAKELYTQFRADQGMVQMFYRIEYARFRYDRTLHGTKDEQDLDELLGFLNLVCRFGRGGYLRTEEMELFDYYLKRIQRDPETRLYIDAVAESREKHGLGAPPWPDLRAYLLHSSESP